jgi:hypothetical protein
VQSKFVRAQSSAFEQVRASLGVDAASARSEGSLGEGMTW